MHMKFEKMFGFFFPRFFSLIKLISYSYHRAVTKKKTKKTKNKKNKQTNKTKQKQKKTKHTQLRIFWPINEYNHLEQENPYSITISSLV